MEEIYGLFIIFYEQNVGLSFIHETHSALYLQNKALKWMWNVIKTQICTIGLSLTLFITVRLPQESSKYGAIPYLVLYSFWLVVVGLPTVLMQLAMGQLSHQDPVGVWRAVPILRGVGHLKILTSYLCCIYYMVVIALSAAYLLWIAKGHIPLKDCTKLQITPNGYENKMNGTECFNTTFLSPFMEHPQYLGVMAILMFVLWFFIPILLYRLRKSLKVSLNSISIIIVIIAILCCSFLSDLNALNEILKSCENWMPIFEPYIWQSALSQVIISTQIMTGYLTSSGGSIYRHSDVRWTATFIIITNLLSSWIWVFLWESISINGMKDKSFVAILVLIYETSMAERRPKIWPLLLYAMILSSGIITILILLFPIFDKLQRISRENWRLFAIALSAIGTALSIAVLVRGLMVATMLDEMVLPILAAFTTAVEVVAFTFIYGWQHVMADIDFLTKSRLPCLWISGWWTTPIILVAMTGWWLKTVLQINMEWMERGQNLWPLIGEFIGIIVIMIVTAAVAVAKEEQFNLFTKISSAFKPSRLWGPKEPLARYVWMSQKFVNEDISSVLAEDIEQNLHYSTIINNITDNNKRKNKCENESNASHGYQSKVRSNKNEVLSKPVDHKFRSKSKKTINETKFHSPNVCIAKGQLGGPVNCSCNRHFTLNVPQFIRNDECSTSL